eukprot:205326-Alexandrium_andersonii.AAC.1
MVAQGIGRGSDNLRCERTARLAILSTRLLPVCPSESSTPRRSAGWHASGSCPLCGSVAFL